MDYKIQDHLCSGDDERLPVTLFIFLFTNIFPALPPFFYLQSFTPLGETELSNLPASLFGQRERTKSVLKRGAAEARSRRGKRKTSRNKIRIVLLFPPSFSIPHFEDHQKSAANRRHWESGWRPAHGLSHWMDQLHLSI